jgi:hypothetical protein
MSIKYFEVISDRLNYPAYYAAYNLDDAKEVAYSDFNSQFVANFREIERDSIPPKSVIHDAKLELADAQLVGDRARGRQN